MKLFGRIRRLFAGSVTDEKMWNPSLWNMLSAQSTSGENVDERNALTYSAVFNAISLISGTIGALPLHLLREAGSSKAIASQDSRHRILHRVSNPYMTAMTLRETMMAHVLSWGNGYAEIVRDGMGNVLELWPITPDRIIPRMVEGSLVYDITVDGEIVRLPRYKVLHLAGLGFDGMVGYSVVNMARNSIGLGKAMETFGSNYFGQGTHPGVIVSHPSKLSPEAHSNLKESLTTAYSGLGNTHRLLLLEEGMSLEKITIPPNDSQFLESRQFQIPEVARWFNLPPHKLKDLTRSSFSNIEQEQISFVTDSILPWLVRLEQSYNMQLLTQSEQRLGRLHFKHGVEGLLRGSSKDRAEFYRKMFGIGAMSINEIRGKEDLDPVEGGDIHLVPLNMTSLENAGKEPEPPAPPALPEPEPEETDDEDSES